MGTLRRELFDRLLVCSTKPIWRKSLRSTQCTTTAIARTSPGHNDHADFANRRIRRKPILTGLINEYEHAA
jgi:hypothetical protein